MPVYKLQLGSKQDVLQGIPFDIKNRNTFGNMGLAGTTPTGTSYDLSANYFRNYGEYEALISDGMFGGTSVQDEFRSSISGSVTQQLLKGHRYATICNRSSAQRMGFRSLG